MYMVFHSWDRIDFLFIHQVYIVYETLDVKNKTPNFTFQGVKLGVNFAIY